MRFSVIFSLILCLNCTSIWAQTPVKVAKAYLENLLLNANTQKTQNSSLELSSYYSPQKSKLHYIYFQHKHQDIAIYNAIYSVLVNDNNEVVYAQNYLAGNLPQVDFSKIISPKQATEYALNQNLTDFTILKQSKNQQGILTDLTALVKDTVILQLQWYRDSELKKTQKATLAWKIEFTDTHTQYHIDAFSGQVLAKIDLVIHCDFPTSEHQHSAQCLDNPDPKITGTHNYQVIDFPAESPLDAPLSIVHKPYTRFAPLGTGPGETNGWHHDGSNLYYTTRGNNVFALEDKDNNSNTEGFSPSSIDHNFVFPYDLNSNNVNDNLSTSVTNLFYWNNLIHDILYRFGFDEPSGNFQTYNMSRGGLGNDAVLAEAFDGGGANNANFFTPIDGQRPRMQMYLWVDKNNKIKDGSFENGIITHEYGHGWTTRLTGGPNNSSCLQHVEQAGEGWSDYLALMLTTDWTSLQPNLASANLPRAMGNYLTTNTTQGGGIRTRLYSYNKALYNNDKTYGSINDLNLSAPHGIGEIWANALWDLTWEMIFEDQQIVDSIYHTQNMVGNVAALKLVNEALRLQPCSPSFIDSRDALFAADSLFFAGKYKYRIDRAFARRGMGYRASTLESANDRKVQEDFSLKYGPKLLSNTTKYVCSNTPFVFSIQFDSTVSQISWQRMPIIGISNPATSQNSPQITETLINTTDRTLLVPYRIFINNQSEFWYTLYVEVSPTINLVRPEIILCQNSSPIAFEGVSYTQNADTVQTYLTTTNQSPLFRRQGQSAVRYYFAPYTFTAKVPGYYDIELYSWEVDAYLQVYSSFNANNPLDNLLDFNDDDDYTTDSRIRIYLNQNQSITIIATTYDTFDYGEYLLRIEPQFAAPLHRWYNDNFLLVHSGTTFQPLDTQLPSLKTYYYQTQTCMYPVQFQIDSTTQAGTIEGIDWACPESTVNLILKNKVGEVVRWEKSIGVSDSYQTEINTLNTFTFSPTSTTYVRAVTKNGTCPESVSTPFKVNTWQTTVNLPNSIASNTVVKSTTTITGSTQIVNTQNLGLTAQNSIVLNPGFTAAPGSTFTAEIGTCP